MQSREMQKQEQKNQLQKTNVKQNSTFSTPQKIIDNQSQLKNFANFTTQNLKIRNQIFLVYKNPTLRGHIKILQPVDFKDIQVIFFHNILNYKVQQSIKISFSQNYPIVPPNITIHSCNLTQIHKQYVIPSFLSFNQFLTNQLWKQNTKLANILANIYQSIQDFHLSEIQRLLINQPKQQSIQIISPNISNQIIEQLQKNIKQRRKSSNMTGCADKQLTQTKNLNRHFRSKLRQVLRDLCPSNQQQDQNFKIIDSIFSPNRVGFQDIRKALSNRWFNQGVKRQMNSGQFLHKVLRGMMGIKSKKLMIKYYHVMASAVEDPNSFIRWKYEDIY